MHNCSKLNIKFTAYFLVMMNLKIAVCDDEIKYIKDIELHLKQYFHEKGLLLNLYKYNNASDLLNSKINFDIVFLDIEMPEVNGIELGKKLQSINPDLILIYITAYNHYLDDALDLDITRFFDKPIDSKRFYKGLDKAIEKLDKTEVTVYLKNTDNSIVTIKMNEIIYIEIEGRKTKIITENEEYYSKSNIKYWLEQLNKSYFECPHHSFIINTNYITHFQKDYVILNKKYTIPIAHAKRSEFKKRFMMLLGE